MLGYRLFRSVRGIGVSLLVAGCGPKIFAFDITPGRVCAGDTVHITWTVRGTPRIEAARLTKDSVAIIRYTLFAESHGKRDSRHLDVVTFSPGAPAFLAFGAGMLGRDSLIGRDTLSPATWHDLLRVGVITSDSGRQVLVSHGGVDAVVGPGHEGNAAWRDKPVSGPWEVRSGLAKGEVPGRKAHLPPSHLFLKLDMICDAGGARPTSAAP